ncbi:AMP-binding protein [Saccharopolyspora sp. NPDC002578]
MALMTVRDRYGEDEIRAHHSNGIWREQRLFDVVEQHAAERGDRLFGTDSTTSCTYRELRDAALRLATGLARRGIVPGDRVAVQLPNWTEFFVIATAIARVGAVVVPIMPIYRRDEVGYIIASAGVRAVFTAPEYRGFDHAGLFLDLARAHPYLHTVVVVRSEEVPGGAVRYHDMFEDPWTADFGPGTGPDEPFTIMYSSGTTAHPKGCVHTFNTMCAGARLLGQAWRYGPADVQFGPSPITHTTGFVTSYLLPLLHGASSHLVERWEPHEGLERIAKFGCTAAVTATTFLQSVIEVYDPDVHDARTMRFWTSAGAPVPGSVVESAREVLPDMQVLSLYGRTENITTTTCTVEDDPSRALTSDGRALPHQEVRIVGLEGEELPRGEQGDIAYRGAMNCLGYINQPEETAANYTADGFHRSGDLGVMDDDGFVRVTGRVKDIIIRGGLNISVRQVEDLLAAHPAVREIACVGMPDQRLGEKMCAYLVPVDEADPPTFEEIKAYLLDAGLAIQKVPERLELIGEMPATATGKIKKHVLRADIKSRLLE